MRAPLLRALGDPAIALLWGGLATSAVGDQLFGVVLSWIAVAAFGTAAGYLTVLQGASALAVTLFLGHLTDRLNPLKVMAYADLARAAILAVTVLTWLATGAAQSWTLLACVVVLAGGMSFFRPAMQASLPGLVRDAAMLPATNALLDTTERIARLLGPGLVGLASLLVPMVHFISIDVVTFALSAAAIVLVARQRPLPGLPPMARETGLEAMLRGVRTVRRHRLLGYILGYTGLLNGAWYATFFLGLPLVVSAAEPGPTGLAHYALLISAYGSANLLGTLIMGSRPLPTRPALYIFAGNLVLGVGIVALGVIPLVTPRDWLIPALAVASAFSAFGGPMQDILVATLRQTELPRPDLPAAVRAFMAANAAGLLATLAITPVLFDTLGVPVAIMLCGAAILAMGGIGLGRFGAGEARSGAPGAV